MDVKRKQDLYRKHLIYIALLTRFVLIGIQFVSNLLIMDHKSDGFVSPGLNETGLFHQITWTFLGGFMHWDGQYFYHIASYGYTYENISAFFPLFPFIISFIMYPIQFLIPFCDTASAFLIVSVLFNLFIFIRSVLALYDLSLFVLNSRLAYKACILFCLNPASIFFIASYSESLYSFCTFTAMLKCVEFYRNSKFLNIIHASVYIALSIATRSNGILNLGFLIYYTLLLNRNKYWPHNIATLINLIKFTTVVGFSLIISISTFILIQIYYYNQFCTDFETNLPKQIIDYANLNQLILSGSGSKYNQTWCFKTVPLAYSYVQEHYWNVGFLKYYHWKQIPNFLLAAPLIYLILIKSYSFLKQHSKYCFSLGLIETQYDTPKLYDRKMFVFVAHAVFLTIFDLLCIHVQVTTRMLCSASPILFWYGAYLFEQINTDDFEMFSNWKSFLLSDDLNGDQKFVKYYFLSYFVVGTILFCNNFPWT